MMYFTLEVEQSIQTCLAIENTILRGKCDNSTHSSLLTQTAVSLQCHVRSCVLRNWTCSTSSKTNIQLHYNFWQGNPGKCEIESLCVLVEEIGLIPTITAQLSDLISVSCHSSLSFTLCIKFLLYCHFMSYQKGLAASTHSGGHCLFSQGIKR